MRIAAIGVLVALVLSACSSPEDGAASGTSVVSARSSSSSATKSAAPPMSAALPPASVSATPPAAGPPRDAEAAVKAIGPFDTAISDAAEIQKRVNAALELCSPAETAPAAGPVETASVGLCTPETHAALLVMRGADAVKKEDAERAFHSAMALDPNVLPPSKTTDTSRDAFASAKKLPKPLVRVGAVTTTDEPTKAGLITSLDKLLPSIRYCYAQGLFTNPNLEGAMTIQADLKADGSLGAVAFSASIPDAKVTACAQRMASRAVLAAPSKAPAKISAPFACSPEAK